MKDTVLVVGQDRNARIIARTLRRARGLRVISVTDATEACDILCCEGAAANTPGSRR